MATLPSRTSAPLTDSTILDCVAYLSGLKGIGHVSQFENMTSSLTSDIVTGSMKVTEPASGHCDEASDLPDIIHNHHLVPQYFNLATKTLSNQRSTNAQPSPQSRSWSSAWIGILFQPFDTLAKHKDLRDFVTAQLFPPQPFKVEGTAWFSDHRPSSLLDRTALLFHHRCCRRGLLLGRLLDCPAVGPPQHKPR